MTSSLSWARVPPPRALAPPNSRHIYLVNVDWLVSADLLICIRVCPHNVGRPSCLDLKIWCVVHGVTMHSLVTKTRCSDRPHSTMPGHDEIPHYSTSKTSEATNNPISLFCNRFQIMKTPISSSCPHSSLPSVHNGTWRTPRWGSSCRRTPKGRRRTVDGR